MVANPRGIGLLEVCARAEWGTVPDLVRLRGAVRKVGAGGGCCGVQAAHRVGYGGWGGAGSFLRRERAGGEETLRVDNL